MATFHRLTDASGKAVIRCFAKSAPDQLLARAATVLDPDTGRVRVVMATVLGPCQAILETTPLDVHQWLLCLGVALAIVVVSEIRKAVLRRTGATVRSE
jgi:hypothetical protein